ncbi:electron transport complex subunit RsxD [Ectothiorhodospiraceae bacterium WFHF3C12]|nr:electron transport complex subunit RsxD [Ectothiorhodospiraceae bacterium WFHF3C12]
MRFNVFTPPHLRPPASVSAMMREVLLALVPGIAAAAGFFGIGVLVNILVATVVAVGAEVVMLRLRARPVSVFINDYSAVVTGVLLGIALPPLAPWWLPALGSAFAIVFGKHLYGGLGYNPFNPAMVGYVVLLISFPREMTLWLPPAGVGDGPVGAGEALTRIFTGSLPPGTELDAVSMATPLDTIKTQLGMARTLGEIQAGPLFGAIAGRGWQWINMLFLLGGAWLIYRRVIDWRIPAGVLGALAAMALVFWAADPDLRPGPVFHLFSGAAMLGAFFIATDPVSAATTPRGRLVYAAGIGVLVYVIRTWGGYPDGVAFAVLLMNMAAPLIDTYTKPRVFGQ